MSARHHLPVGHRSPDQRRGRSLAERFWEKVNKNGPVPERCPELGPCWLWTAGTNAKGYGSIGTHRAASGRMATGLAHRVAWELVNGPIPEGDDVLHRCDTPPCVNPAHHFLGTPADNAADRTAKGRSASGEKASHSRSYSEGLVQAVRLSYLAGEHNCDTLAARHGMTQGAAYAIVTGRTWRWLPWPNEDPTSAYFQEWLKVVGQACAERADLEIGPLAIDGLVLVRSRSVEHAHHEVRTSGRVAVSCSCWPSRRGRPCSHRAAVAIRLWEDEMEVDLSAVPALALTNTLISAYLEPPPGTRGRQHAKPWLSPSDGPETKLPASPPTGPTYENVGGRLRAALT